MNHQTGREKGLKDGDIIRVESRPGRTVAGPVKLMEGIHPRTLGIAACSGHWAKGLPLARDKGVHFNVLMEVDFEHLDPITLNVETCVRVKVEKIQPARKKPWWKRGSVAP